MTLLFLYLIPKRISEKARINIELKGKGVN